MAISAGDCMIHIAYHDPNNRGTSLPTQPTNLADEVVRFRK